MKTKISACIGVLISLLLLTWGISKKDFLAEQAKFIKASSATDYMKIENIEVDNLHKVKQIELNSDIKTNWPASVDLQTLTQEITWSYASYITNIDSIVTQVTVSGEGVEPAAVLGVYPFIGLNANDTEIFNDGTYQIACPLVWDPQYTIAKPPYDAGLDELFMSRSTDRNPSSIYDPKDEFTATGTPTVVRAVVTNMAVTTNLAVWTLGVLPDKSNSFTIAFNGTNVFNITAGEVVPVITFRANSKICFGTSTNFIQDQNGTNYLFMCGTNWANFSWE